MGVGRIRWCAGATWVLASIAGLIIAAAMAAAMPASAAETTSAATVSASYTPDELQLLPGETRTAVLLIENPTTVAVRVTPTVAQPANGSGPVTVELDSTARSIPAGGSIALDATVKVVQRAAFPVTVVTTITYNGTGVSGSALASLKVTSAATPTAAQGALVITASGDASMVDTSGADVVFIVQNNGATPQKITKATLTFPTFLQVELADGSVSGQSPGTMRVRFKTDTLTAGNGTAIHLRLTAPKGVQPGNALITLSLNYDDTISGTPAFSTGTHTIALAVFGEDAVKGVFGAALAPALFVVPGLLFVLVLWFLWMRVYPRSFPVDVTPPPAISAVALAILGVLCALPFPYLYRLVTGRDYIVVYGFADIGLMCALGIATGAVVWGVGLGIRGIVRLFRLMPDDPAPKVLRKITRGHRDLADVRNALHTKPHAAETSAEEAGLVFILRIDGTTALVCPSIQVPTPPAVEDFSTKFTDLLASKDNRGLYRHLKQNGVLALAEYTVSNVDTVTPAKLTDLDDFARGQIVSWTVPGAETDAPSTQ